MPKIIIVSASVRTGRQSHRVSLFLKDYIEENRLASVEILDLLTYNFPVFNERLKYQKEPSAAVLDFAERVSSADGVIIVTPEYNGGYPASLKNAIDLLTTEWIRKPVAISTVSDGSFGGTQVLISLQFTLWKMKAWTVSAMLPFPKAGIAFDEKGKALDVKSVHPRTAAFVNELLWCIEARNRMTDTPG